MRVNRQITRRIFLGSLILLMALLAACTSSEKVEEQVVMTLTAIYISQPTSTSTATPQPSPTLTLTPILPPSATELPPPTVTETPTPSCLGLLEPKNGASLPATGKQTFAWEPLSGATLYLLEINPPPWHYAQVFESQEPSLHRWLNTIPWEGEYSWHVSALDASGQVICISGPFTFTKPEFVPTSTPKKEPPPYATQETMTAPTETP